MVDVVNTHHFGGVDKLPPSTVYIGRPGPYGNPYSSASGAYTKEESVALHRIHLYQSLINDASLFSTLKRDLEGKDLACWCKNPHRIFTCHGDNYLHILNPSNRDRTYTKPVISYLMEDLRHVLKAVGACILQGVSQEKFLDLFLAVHEFKLELEELFAVMKLRKTSQEVACITLSYIVIDLEMSVMEKTDALLDYRLSHATWRCHHFIDGRVDRDNEPDYPNLPRKPKRVKEK